MALSLHEVDDEAPGVLVLDGSAVGEPVGGICVDTVKACLVGGRVEVTMRGGVGVAVSCACEEMSTQDVDASINMSVSVIFFSMRLLRFARNDN